jgi:hypothetical protein
MFDLKEYTEIQNMNGDKSIGTIEKYVNRKEKLVSSFRNKYKII